MSEIRRRIDLSVLILSYNRPEYLKEAVRSVLLQDVIPISITILDNGSSPDVKSNLMEEIDQGVTWEGALETSPSIWNFRRAMKMARGKYFYLMHDDDRLLPGFLGKMFDYLEKNEHVIAIGCNANVIDAKGNGSGITLLKKGKTDVIVFNGPPEMALQYARSFIPFPSIVYRTGFPQKVPLKEEDGKVGDAFFLCELASHGKIAYLDEAYFEYRMHSGQDSSAFPFEQLRKRNEYLLTVSQSNRKIHSRVLRNISRFETRQALMNVLISAWKTRSPEKVMERIEEVRTPHFNPLYIPLIMIWNDWRNIHIWFKVLRPS
jgi:glycosyltransferase involved in cell wall biosynthesis